jgi:hypothetical protein
LGELAKLTDDGRFAESRALVTQYLADDTIKGPLRAMLESVQEDLLKRRPEASVEPND